MKNWDEFARIKFKSQKQLENFTTSPFFFEFLGSNFIGEKLFKIKCNYLQFFKLFKLLQFWRWSIETR